MKRIRLSYDNETSEIVELVKQDYQLGCPRCDSDLIVGFYIVPDTEEKLPHTIDCPQNPNHFGILLDYNLTDFWQKVEDRMKKQNSKV